MVDLSRLIGRPILLAVEILVSLGFLVVATVYAAVSLIIAVFAWLSGEWSLGQEARRTKRMTRIPEPGPTQSAPKPALRVVGSRRRNRQTPASAISG